MSKFKLYNKQFFYYKKKKNFFNYEKVEAGMSGKSENLTFVTIVIDKHFKRLNFLIINSIKKKNLETVLNKKNENVVIPEMKLKRSLSVMR